MFRTDPSYRFEVFSGKVIFVHAHVNTNVVLSVERNYDDDLSKTWSQRGTLAVQIAYLYYEYYRKTTFLYYCASLLRIMLFIFIHFSPTFDLLVSV